MENRPSNKGQILKKLRESKGISLETVHESTKIPLDALKAIEEGYTIRTLSSFYYRGFLKIYAQFLKVDVGEILDDYHPEKIPQPKVEKKESFSAPSFKLILTPEQKSLIIKILTGILALIVAIRLIAFVVHKISNRSGEKSRAAEQSSKKKTSTKASASSSKADKPKLNSQALAQKTSSQTSLAPAKGSAGNAVGQPISLAVRAKKDNWLQVKVDGQVVFRSTLRKGAVETWNAHDRVELSGKDIGELEFELNGKIIGPLGKENRKAKKVVINQSGFSVVE